MGADRCTVGPPPNQAGSNQYDNEAITVDIQNGDLYVSGNGRTFHALRKVIQTLQAQTALTAITTAQNLLSLTFNNKGRLLFTNRTVKVTLWLIYNSTSANVAALTFALSLGGVALCSIPTAATNTAASTGLPVKVEFEFSVAALTTGGTAATIESHGRVDANISANTPAAAVATYLDTNTAVSSAVNLTTALTMLVTVAASAAVPSMQVRMARVELLN